MEERYALTTIDNPYDPFTQFQQWYLFDVEKGYNTCAYLARICKSSKAYSPAEENEAVSKAIDEILKYDFMNIYIKVKSKVNN